MGCGASSASTAEAPSMASISSSDTKPASVDIELKSHSAIVTTTLTDQVNSLAQLATESAKLAPFIALLNTAVEPTRSPTAAAECAVSLSFLIKWANAAPSDYSTADVCYSLVKPITSMAECRLTGEACFSQLSPSQDSLSLYLLTTCLPHTTTDTMHPGDVGPPNFFISHRWGMSFQELIASVRDQLPGADFSKVLCCESSLTSFWL